MTFLVISAHMTAGAIVAFVSLPSTHANGRLTVQTSNIVLWKFVVANGYSYVSRQNKGLYIYTNFHSDA